MLNTLYEWMNLNNVYSSRLHKIPYSNHAVLHMIMDINLYDKELIGLAVLDQRPASVLMELLNHRFVCVVGGICKRIIL